MKAVRAKVAWRAIHGVLLLDKPVGITSTAALARARRALRAEKGGHTGTLDPMASGLLPLCFGEATKFASDLLEADKSYEATIQLGVVTATGDAEGEVIERHAVDVDRGAVERVLAMFRGPIAQVPPMHSALKRDGKPLYDYARRGITLERATRAVRIHRLDLVALERTCVTIRVDCSKGTYVRTLGEDIGRALGCGGHLVVLRRMATGPMRIADAHRLEDFEALSEEGRVALLRPVDALIGTLPRVVLDGGAARRFLDGQRLAVVEASLPGRVRVYRQGVDGEVEGLLGTALLGDDGVLAPSRVVAQNVK